MRLNLQLFLEIPVPEYFHRVKPSPHKTLLQKGVKADLRAIRKTVQIPQVHHRHLALETRVVESAFGKSPIKRRLSAFKTMADRASRPGSLPLASAAACFAVPGTLSTAEPFPAVLGAANRLELMQSHEENAELRIQEHETSKILRLKVYDPPPF